MTKKGIYYIMFYSVYDNTDGNILEEGSTRSIYACCERCAKNKLRKFNKDKYSTLSISTVIHEID